MLKLPRGARAGAAILLPWQGGFSHNPRVAPAGFWPCEYRGAVEPLDHRVPLVTFAFWLLWVLFWTLWLCAHSPGGVHGFHNPGASWSPPRLHPTGHGLYESPPDVFYGFSAPLVEFYFFPFFLFFLLVCFLAFSFLTFCFLCLFCFFACAVL